MVSSLKPYDVRIITASGTIQTVLAKDDRGEVLWTRRSAPTLTPSINQEGVSSYAAFPPDQGVASEVGDVSAGAGFWLHQPGTYAFGANVDTSLGIVYPGPQVVQDTVNGGTALDGPVWAKTHHHDTDYIAAGSKVYKWDYTNNYWVATATQPAATTTKITDIISYEGLLLVAHDSLVPWEYSEDDGATWLVAPTSSDPRMQRFGKHFAIIAQRTSRPILVMVDDPNFIWTTEDPRDAALWDPGALVGDGDDAGADHFTALFTAPTGELIVGKRLGWYQRNPQGEFDQMYGPIQSSAGIGLENFAWMQAVGQRVYTQCVDYSVLEMERGTVNQQDLGMSANGPNVPEMQRAVAALAGDGTRWLYAGMSGTEGYVMRGRWQGGRWAWHGSYLKTGVTIGNRMWTTSHPLGSDTGTYLVISSLSSPYLPYRALIPTGDLETNTDARFATAGSVRFGWQDLGVADITKILSRSKPITRNLTSARTVQVSYRVNSATSFTSLNTFTESPEPTSESTMYYPAGTNGKRFEIKATYALNAATVWLAVERIITRVFPRPPRLDILDFTVLAETGVYTRTGVPSRLSAQQLKQQLYDAQRVITPPTVVQDWDTNAVASVGPSVWTVDIQNIEEVWVKHNDQKPALAYRVTCLELPTIAAVARSIDGVPHNHALESFTATASQTVFTLAHTPICGVIIFAGTTYQREGTEYTRSGATITFASGLTVGTIVQVRNTY